MRMNQLIKVCVAVAMVSIVLGMYPSSSYGQDTAAANGAVDPPSPNYYNANIGYGV